MLAHRVLSLDLSGGGRWSMVCVCVRACVCRVGERMGVWDGVTVVQSVESSWQLIRCDCMYCCISVPVVQYCCIQCGGVWQSLFSVGSLIFVSETRGNVLIVLFEFLAPPILCFCVFHSWFCERTLFGVGGRAWEQGHSSYVLPHEDCRDLLLQHGSYQIGVVPHLGCSWWILQQGEGHYNFDTAVSITVEK